MNSLQWIAIVVCFGGLAAFVYVVFKSIVGRVKVQESALTQAELDFERQVTGVYTGARANPAPSGGAPHVGLMTNGSMGDSTPIAGIEPAASGMDAANLAYTRANAALNNEAMARGELAAEPSARTGVAMEPGGNPVHAIEKRLHIAGQITSSGDRVAIPGLESGGIAVTLRTRKTMLIVPAEAAHTWIEAQTRRYDYVCVASEKISIVTRKFEDFLADQMFR